VGHYFSIHFVQKTWISGKQGNVPINKTRDELRCAYGQAKSLFYPDKREDFAKGPGGSENRLCDAQLFAVIKI
jgi:hypothetical protein